MRYLSGLRVAACVAFLAGLSQAASAAEIADSGDQIPPHADQSLLTEEPGSTTSAEWRQ